MSALYVVPARPQHLLTESGVGYRLDFDLDPTCLVPPVSSDS